MTRRSPFQMIRPLWIIAAVIADSFRARHVVRDRDRGRAKPLHAIDDQPVDDRAHDRIEPGRRLVKKQDIRLRRDRASQGYAFLHPARKFRRRQDSRRSPPARPEPGTTRRAPAPRRGVTLCRASSPNATFSHTGKLSNNAPFWNSMPICARAASRSAARHRHQVAAVDLDRTGVGLDQCRVCISAARTCRNRSRRSRPATCAALRRGRCHPARPCRRIVCGRRAGAVWAPDRSCARDATDRPASQPVVTVGWPEACRPRIPCRSRRPLTTSTRPAPCPRTNRAVRRKLPQMAVRAERHARFSGLRRAGRRRRIRRSFRTDHGQGYLQEFDWTGTRDPSAFPVDAEPRIDFHDAWAAHCCGNGISSSPPRPRRWWRAV